MNLFPPPLPSTLVAGVWLKLPPPLASHVPIAIRKGFRYHHAEEGARAYGSS